MNILKKAFALLLALVMVFSFTACHEKDELAVTVKNGDKTIEFTSAMYLCALMNADGEAYQKAQTQITEAKVDTTNMTSDQYVALVYSQKLDEKDYVTWVKDRAKDMLSEYAAYKFLCDQNGVTPSEKHNEDAQYSIDSGWYGDGYYSAGNGYIYEPNGVSYKSYQTLGLYAAYAQAYFDSLYAEGGKNAVSKEDILKAMDENYAIANIITVDTSKMKDTEKAEAQKKLEGYIARLKKGEDFEKIYKEHNGIKDPATTSSTTSTSSTASNTSSTNTSSATSSETEKELTPKDEYATLLGSEKAGSTDEAIFKIVKEMKIGEMKVHEDKEAKTLTLLVRGDMMADEYYTENLVDSVLQLLKGDEFDKAIDEFVKTLAVNIDADAVEPFDVKNLYKYS